MCAPIRKFVAGLSILGGFMCRVLEIVVFISFKFINSFEGKLWSLLMEPCGQRQVSVQLVWSVGNQPHH